MDIIKESEQKINKNLAEAQEQLEQTQESITCIEQLKKLCNYCKAHPQDERAIKLLQNECIEYIYHTIPPIRTNDLLKILENNATIKEYLNAKFDEFLRESGHIMKLKLSGFINDKFEPTTEQFTTYYYCVVILHNENNYLYSIDIPYSSSLYNILEELTNITKTKQKDTKKKYEEHLPFIAEEVTKALLVHIETEKSNTAPTL